MLADAVNKGPNTTETKFYSMSLRLEDDANFVSVNRKGGLFDEFHLNERDRTIARLLFFDAEDHVRPYMHTNMIKQALLAVSKDERESAKFRDKDLAGAMECINYHLQKISEEPDLAILTKDISRRLPAYLPGVMAAATMPDPVLGIVMQASPLDLWEGLIKLGKQPKEAQAMLSKFQTARSIADLSEQTGFAPEALTALAEHIMQAEQELLNPEKES